MYLNHKFCALYTCPLPLEDKAVTYRFGAKQSSRDLLFPNTKLQLLGQAPSVKLIYCGGVMGQRQIGGFGVCFMRVW